MKKTFIFILLSVLFTFIPITIIWTHHYIVTGLNPFFAVIIIPFMLLAAILIYRLLIKIFKRYISFTPDTLFATGLFSYLFLLCVLKIFYGNSALDIHLHDTYFTMSYFYPLLFAASAFAVFTVVYYWFDKMFRRQMNYTLGYIHFWISFLGINFLLLPAQYIQLVGMPRRYYDYSVSDSSNIFNNQSIFICVLTFLLAGAQLLFVFNFCFSIFRKNQGKNAHT
ncbi:MAG: cbb3-type cytochrome c oxidase subunit I [Ferruginibacter sp.]